MSAHVAGAWGRADGFKETVTGCEVGRDSGEGARRQIGRTRKFALPGKESSSSRPRHWRRAVVVGFEKTVIDRTALVSG